MKRAASRLVFSRQISPAFDQTIRNPRVKKLSQGTFSERTASSTAIGKQVGCDDPAASTKIVEIIGDGNQGCAHNRGFYASKKES